METRSAQSAPSLEPGQSTLLQGLVSIVVSLVDGIGQKLSLLVERAAAERSRPDHGNDWEVASERQEYLRKAETMRTDARLGIRRIGEY